MVPAPKNQLGSLARDLVASVAPNVDPQTATSWAKRELRADTTGGTRKEWTDVEASISSLVRTCRVRVQDDLADALEKALSTLKEHRDRGQTAFEGDLPIKMGNLPDYVQLLLNLSNPPTSATSRFAQRYLKGRDASGPTPEQLLYREIMSEPFEGAHWEKGYDEEVKEGWTDSESSSGQSEDELVTPSTARIGRLSADMEQLEAIQEARAREESEERLDNAQARLKALKEGAYWRGMEEELPALPERLNGWRELALEGAPVHSYLGSDASSPGQLKLISAQALQRELLFALSGRSGVLLAVNPTGECTIIEGHPQVRQFSPSTLHAILREIRRIAGQAAQIRMFITDCARSSSGSSHSSRNSNQTGQAFAHACQEIITTFDQWIADQELAMIRGVDPTSAQTAATPLALEHRLADRFGELLDYITGLLSAAESPVMLINSMYSALTNLPPTSRSNSLHSTLFRVFTLTAEPMWAMLGQWLQRGMPVPSGISADSDEVHMSLEDEKRLDPEFFIERDRDISWTDEDFWESAFVSGTDGWPMFLGSSMEEMVLEAGKAKGLLVAFDSPGTSTLIWPSLCSIFSEDAPDGEGVHLVVDPNREIQFRVEDYLTPICQVTISQLRRVLDDECGLSEHLQAVEGLMYMRGHSVINEWLSQLFHRVQSRKPWADFQVLTASLRDTIEHRGELWMNAKAIRIRAKPSIKDSSAIFALGTVKASYDMPFPLSQLFSPTSLEIRAEVFTFLLQMRYALYTLASSRIYDTDFLCSARATREIKLVWTVRQELSWVISIIFSWIMRDVIEVETLRFRHALDKTPSLKAVINLELSHVKRVRALCFLHASTDDLYHHIMAILEMTTELHRAYSAYMTDTSLHQASRSVIHPNQVRTRKRAGNDSDDDSDDAGGMSDDEAEVEDLSTVLAEESLGSRMKRLGTELDERIRDMIDGVEDLATRTNDTQEAIEDSRRSTWEVLRFALGDWGRYRSSRPASN